MRAARMRVALAALCTAVAGMACGKQATEPHLGAELPPSVIEVHPPARAARVLAVTPIWARFDRPLDRSTVNTRTVFLKIDTRRIPVIVTLTDSNRTIRIEPPGPLELRRTHTVELTAAIRTQDGGGLSQTYFWQFQVQSVRLPRPARPGDGAADRSPVEPLWWAPTDSAGSMEYRLMVSSDSAAVAAGTAPSVVVSQQPYLPSSRWTSGATFYWSVRARNLETGEERDGPMASFSVIAADAPKDTVYVPLTDPGTYNRGTWQCPNLSSGTTGVIGMFRLDGGALGPDPVVHDAKILLIPLTFITPTTFAQAAPYLERMDRDWIACSSAYPGPPPNRETGNIASAALGDDAYLHYESGVLAAHVQHALRGGALRGFVLRSYRSVSYAGTGASPGFRIIHYVRPGQARRAAATRGDAPGDAHH